MKRLENSILSRLETFSMLRLATLVPVCEEITGIYPNLNLTFKENFKSFYNGFDSNHYKKIYGNNPTRNDRWDFCVDCLIANIFKHQIEDAGIMLDYMKMPQKDLDNIRVIDYAMQNKQDLGALNLEVFLIKCKLAEESAM